MLRHYFPISVWKDFAFICARPLRKIGKAGRLFTIQSDYQVAEVADNYTAVGCGQDYALGSLYATLESIPTKRIKLALETAAYFSAAVRPPFVIEKLACE